MYSRALASSAEPAGRGPISTCLRTCSKARSPSKATAVGGVGDCGVGETVVVVGVPPVSLFCFDPPGQAIKVKGRKIESINVQVVRDLDRRLFMSNFFIYPEVEPFE